MYRVNEDYNKYIKINKKNRDKVICLGVLFVFFSISYMIKSMV